MKYDVQIVKHEQYNGYEYFIVYVDGLWYCAYVIIPEGHPLFEVHYDNIENIETHGGFTFADHHRLAENQWCIGWDYAHIGDYMPIFGDYRDEMEDGFGMPPHHWTPEEIEDDCKDVIGQLNDRYKNENII